MSLFRNQYTILLILIILLSIFFRSYEFVERFEFAHDGDLYSWTVKDIVIDKHLRLIGQETSTQGVFIGPLFYYILIPFFLLTSMDPIGVIGFSVLLGVFTTISFYFVFKKLFNIQTGLIAAFLHAILVPRVLTDRWVVPTVTSSLWEIWFLFALLMTSKGNFGSLPLLGLLVGLIWHINLSLTPLLLTIPVAIYLSKKIPTLKDIIKALVAAFIPLVPLILFEIKHNFQQTKGIFASFFIDQGGTSGFYKLTIVLDQIYRNVVNLFLYPQTQLFVKSIPFFIIIFAVAFLLFRKNGLIKEYKIVLVWFLSVVIFFSLSSKITSEYYFNNLTTVFLSIGIIGISLIFAKTYKTLAILILTALLLNSTYHLIIQYRYNPFGLKERNEAAEFIANDSKMKGFPCVSVSYITTPGNDLGFRYVFYLNNLHANQSKSGSPNYTIVIPGNLYNIVSDEHFGVIGVITPKGSYNMKEVEYSCSGQNANLTDPLFGFTK